MLLPVLRLGGSFFLSQPCHALPRVLPSLGTFWPYNVQGKYGGVFGRGALGRAHLLTDYSTGSEWSWGALIDVTKGLLRLY